MSPRNVNGKKPALLALLALCAKICMFMHGDMYRYSFVRPRTPSENLVPTFENFPREIFSKVGAKFPEKASARNE